MARRRGVDPDLGPHLLEDLGRDPAQVLARQQVRGDEAGGEAHQVAVLDPLQGLAQPGAQLAVVDQHGRALEGELAGGPQARSLRQARRHEAAPALHGLDPARPLQARQGLEHREPVDPPALGQLRHRRQARARPPLAFLDQPPQPPLELQIQGAGGARVEGGIENHPHQDRSIRGQKR